MKAGIKMRKIRTTKKWMKATIFLPLLLCFAIILGLCFDFIRFNSVQEISSGLDNANELNYANVLMSNVHTHESLTLSLIGIAIAVWIGLNIYNVLSKEELRVILDRAQEITEVTEQMYTEILKSKFRILSSSTASEYFATQLGYINRLPMELSEKIFELEDIFQVSYHLYGDESYTDINLKGADFAKNLKELTEEYKNAKKLSYDQYHFLMGYTSWRWGDFLHYKARYDKKNKPEEYCQTAKSAIEQYIQAGKWLFHIQKADDFSDAASYSPENQKFLAYLANDIASTYVDIIQNFSKEELKDVTTMAEAAINYSTELPNKVREKFYRNLGSAYEKSGNMSDALEQYKRAYQIAPSNWRCAYCIASWYRKQALIVFYKQIDTQNYERQNFYNVEDNKIEQLTGKEWTELIWRLEKAVYWYSDKQVNHYGQADVYLVEINDFLYRLTRDEVYMRKSEEAWKYMGFVREITQI
ncbi:hypothetical protein D1646_14020 [Pseudoflavonifractor sp. 60]|uniref:tetratricopeptide repeat protein n=1 Tax=Pseudoflavonifractor sp. 60 TaxID=2304576 RepID=UPI001370C1D0|nr:tetratricopeptide repeat protein [Pseudoflavonifractor sp. 60]NBI67898.1 hypothetical protein [Pseudoflavonifractor sp. 60]